MSQSPLSVLWHKYSGEKPSAPLTIVCLHGFLASRISFDLILPSLQKLGDVCTIDWPPFGESEKPMRFQYSTSSIAQTIAAVIEHVPTPLLLFGHSMGGQLALRLASLPQVKPKVVGVVTAASSGYMERFPRKLRALTYLPFASYIAQKRLEKTGVRGNLEVVLHDQRHITEELIRAYEAPFQQRRIFQGILRMVRHREADLSTAELRNIKAPVLLLYGKHDRVIRETVVQRFATDLPNATTSPIEAGHLILEEQPIESFHRLVDWMHKTPSLTSFVHDIS
ncbi:alpha/beta fold hydrolase [Bacillus fonticola]|uniref:alpha/beta fold hydrolase n=1 Tax=Bacillus fonticola TaxID=2728853 RepID=UPI001475C7C0|nr:alpha/beta hydrolase [Bacillus fonticola]